jgi:hypothetical protein
MINHGLRVDVVILAEDRVLDPAELSKLAPASPREEEQVDVTPNPHRRIIVLAPTKEAGYEEARAQGIEPVAVVTPRSLDAARGITADAIHEHADLTPEQRDDLTPHVLPSLATTPEADA